MSTHYSALDSDESATINKILRQGPVHIRYFSACYKQRFNFHPDDITIGLLDIDEQDRVTGWTTRTVDEIQETLRNYSARGLTRINWVK